MNAVRGAIVVVIALVIGVVILARGLDEPDSAAPVQTTDTTAAATTTTVAEPAPPPAPAPSPQDAAPPPAPPEAAPPPPPSPDDIPADIPDDMIVASAPLQQSPVPPRNEVRVLVANGTSVCGAAGRLATSLSAQGFNVLPAVNAETAAEVSTVYYVEQYGAAASVVTSLLQGADPSRVAPMPANPPTDPGNSHILIHIGADDLAQPNC